MSASEVIEELSQTTIKQIITAIDKGLKIRKKSYASLAFANELLIEKGIFSKEDQQKNVLKKILKQGLIPHAYQTERKPKQWRIPISDKGKKDLQNPKEVLKFQKHQALFDSYTICPRCKVSLTIPKEISHEKFLVCLNCGVPFPNPLLEENHYTKRRKQSNSISDKNEHTNNQGFREWYNQLDHRQRVGFRRLIIICSIVLIVIIVNIIPDNRPQLIKSLDENYIGREWTDYTHNYFNSYYGPGRPLYYHDQMWVVYYPKGDFTLRISKKSNRIIGISSGMERR